MSNVKEILEQLGYKITRKNKDNYSCAAIYRGGDNPIALSVNAKSGCYYDFVTGSGGSFKSLIYLTLKDNPELASKIQIGDLTDALKNDLHDSGGRPQIEMPKTISKDELDKLFPLYDFYLKRGISEETLKIFKCGYSMEGKMYQRIVFPVFAHDTDSLIGMAGRSVSPSRLPKWKIIGKKANFIYPLFLNHKEILDSGTVILVESIGDVLACWEAGVENVLCLFGVELSSKLMSALVSLAKNIKICLNNDVNGVGQASSEKIKKKLSTIYDKGQITILSCPVNDVGDLLITKGCGPVAEFFK